MCQAPQHSKKSIQTSDESAKHNSTHDGAGVFPLQPLEQARQVEVVTTGGEGLGVVCMRKEDRRCNKQSNLFVLQGV